MSLTEKRSYYKPFEYPWAFEAYEIQSNMHWLPSEIALHGDITDWNGKLSKDEKELLTQLFRFFTQADVDVAEGYLDKYIPIFKPPEIRMMLSTFASMEAIHIHSYSLLLDTVGMPEVEYKRFQEFEDMKAKHDFLENTSLDSPENIAKGIAIYSAFGEGLQLFSSFALLLNFPRHNKMKGMGQIVTYSIRDESEHVKYMIKLFHEYISENPKIWKSSLKKEIYEACQVMVDLEYKFIDLAYGNYSIEGLDKEELKTYIRYIADRRLLQLGLKPIYKQKTNPLEWIDWMVNAVEHMNFFEGRPTAYSKGTLVGSWEDIWND